MTPAKNFPLFAALLGVVLGPLAFGGEPIQVAPAFTAKWKPFPASWHGKRLLVTVESPATGGKAAGVRLAKSSGDARADKIAVEYVQFVLANQANLRAKNAANVLTFPLFIDGNEPNAQPVKTGNAPGDIIYKAGLNGYELPPPQWPNNALNLAKSARLTVRVGFGEGGRAQQVSVVQSSGSTFVDGVATRWATANWKCAPDRIGTALLVPVGMRLGPSYETDRHKPFNQEVRGQEASAGRSEH